jgi:hypothetical protein
MREAEALLDRETTRPAHLAERWLAESYELLQLGWCRHAQARDLSDRPVAPESPQARAWSAPGAVTRSWRLTCAVDGLTGLAGYMRANLALAAATGAAPTAWNDEEGRRKEQVLEAILEAVSIVRAGPLRESRKQGGHAPNGGASAPAASKSPETLASAFHPLRALREVRR